MGRAEDGIVWMRALLNSSTLPDVARAAMSYELAVALWKVAFDSTYRYVSKNEPAPVVEVPKIRELVDEGYSNIQVAQALEPMYANSWFYEKLLVLIELAIETDPEKQKVLKERAGKAQDKFLSVLREHSIVVDGLAADEARPYRSGMPSLTIAPTPPPPPLPRSPGSQRGNDGNSTTNSSFNTPDRTVLCVEQSILRAVERAHGFSGWL